MNIHDKNLVRHAIRQVLLNNSYDEKIGGLYLRMPTTDELADEMLDALFGSDSNGEGDSVGEGEKWSWIEPSCDCDECVKGMENEDYDVEACIKEAR